MRALLRLFPRRWRARYGEDFAVILAGTPPGPAYTGAAAGLGLRRART